jgi:hypothetical protein
VEEFSSIKGYGTGWSWKVSLYRPNPFCIGLPESIVPVAERPFNPRPRESYRKISTAINW